MTAKKKSTQKATKKPPASAPYAKGKWASAFSPRAPGETRAWLVKSEPEVFSFDALWHAPNRTAAWDGVRNFAARNFLRDGMRVGDRVFFYHSMAIAPAIVGTCEVVREGYPDPTAFNRTHPEFDRHSDRDTPTWFAVDVRATAPFPHPVTLARMKARPELARMALLRVGRLSITPVSPAEWTCIMSLAEG